jgi:DNA-binding GntR family transcriptional regulator
MERLASIDTFATEAGATVTTRDLHWALEPADAKASAKLRIPVGDPTVTVTRRKLIDSQPIATIIDQVDARRIGLEELREQFRGSVLDVLLDRPDIDLEFADCDLTVESAEKHIAKDLRLKPGAAVVHIDTIEYNVHGDPVLWGRVWLSPKHFVFKVRRMLPLTR